MKSNHVDNTTIAKIVVYGFTIVSTVHGIIYSSIHGIPEPENVTCASFFATVGLVILVYLTFIWIGMVIIRLIEKLRCKKDE